MDEYYSARIALHLLVTGVAAKHVELCLHSAVRSRKNQRRTGIGFHGTTQYCLPWKMLFTRTSSNRQTIITFITKH